MGHFFVLWSVQQIVKADNRGGWAVDGNNSATTFWSGQNACIQAAMGCFWQKCGAFGIVWSGCALKWPMW